MVNKLHRVMLNDSLLGYWQTGMKLFVSSIPSDVPRFMAMLYIEDSMDEVTVENLTKLANSGWVSDTEWFPLVTGATYLEAIENLNVKLGTIRGDKVNMDLWWFDVSSAQRQISLAINNRCQYEIDGASLKLYQRPDYMV